MYIAKIKIENESPDSVLSTIANCAPDCAVRYIDVNGNRMRITKEIINKCVFKIKEVPDDN